MISQHHIVNQALHYYTTVHTICANSDLPITLYEALKPANGVNVRERSLPWSV